MSDRNRIHRIGSPTTVTTTTTTSLNLPPRAVNRSGSSQPATDASTSNEAFPFPSVTPQSTAANLPSSPQPPAAVHQSQRTTPPQPSRPAQRIQFRRAPSIGISRTNQPAVNVQNGPSIQVDRSNSGRRRSSSEPQRPQNLMIPHNILGRSRTPENNQSQQRTSDAASHMPIVAEEGNSPARTPGIENVPPRLSSLQNATDVRDAQYGESNVSNLDGSQDGTRQRANSTGGGGRNFLRFRRNANRRQTHSQSEYQNDVVDMLDVIDPEVSTLSTLTNVQNSLFIPDLGRLVNRRPLYTLRRHSSTSTEEDTDKVDRQSPQRPDYQATLGRTVSRIMFPDEQPAETGSVHPTLQRQRTSDTISSNLTESQYAVLPHGISLEGWSQEDKDQLNDHVRHMLHSRRSKFKRAMRGFGQYVRRPLGFLVTLYATLITLFGLAWVLFLIGWIYAGDRNAYVVHIIDSVLVALFAIMGDGLAPFRAVDTYHMCFIARYHHLTWKLRKKQRLPDLQDRNDLPGQRIEEADIEKLDDEEAEFSVLKPEQQKKLDHHAYKFARSHTFYKPHETETHHAFPLSFLIAIVVLLDCHSLLQIALGATTWGWYYKDRPFAVTTVILCLSITCNITAGILISVGDKRSRKKDVVERMFRQTLTEEAMGKMARRKTREEKEAREKIEQDRLANEEHERAEAEKRAAVLRAHEKLEAEKRRKEEHEQRVKEREWEERKEEFKERFRPSMDESKRGRGLFSDDSSGADSPGGSKTPTKGRKSLDERRKPRRDDYGGWGRARKSMDAARGLRKPSG